MCLSELCVSACAVYTHWFQLIWIFALTYDENRKQDGWGILDPTSRVFGWKPGLKKRNIVAARWSVVQKTIIWVKRGFCFPNSRHFTEVIRCGCGLEAKYNSHVI